MNVLIDSNIVIAFLKGEKLVVNKIKEIVKQRKLIFISTISIYEIYYGIIANMYIKGGIPSKVPELISIYEKFLSDCRVLDFTKKSAEKAAEIYAKSQGKGSTIKEKDCQIAGIGLVHGISEVITRDERDFSKIFKLTGLNYSKL